MYNKVQCGNIVLLSPSGSSISSMVNLVQFIDNRKFHCVINHISTPVCYYLKNACVLRHRFTEILDFRMLRDILYFFTTVDLTNDANVGQKMCLGSTTFGLSGKLDFFVE